MRKNFSEKDGRAGNCRGRRRPWAELVGGAQGHAGMDAIAAGLVGAGRKPRPARGAGRDNDRPAPQGGLRRTSTAAKKGVDVDVGDEPPGGPLGRPRSRKKGDGGGAFRTTRPAGELSTAARAAARRRAARAGGRAAVQADRPEVRDGGPGASGGSCFGLTGVMVSFFGFEKRQDVRPRR